MKAVVALLIGAVASIKLNDAPPYFNEPTWRQTWPSAAGFVQLDSSVATACEQFGGVGVTCGPTDEQLFAVGMNGDEDLGQDIIMKGQKFHYGQEVPGYEISAAQWVPVEVKSTKPLPVCHGNNGPDGVNCKRGICNGTNGPKDGPTGTPCDREEPASGDYPPTTTGNLTPHDVTLKKRIADQQLVMLEQPPFEQYESKAPEKVLVPQTTHARHHTTYY